MGYRGRWWCVKCGLSCAGKLADWTGRGRRERMGRCREERVGGRIGVERKEWEEDR